MMGGYGLIAGFGWVGMLVMALFWIGVILLIVWGSARWPRRASRMSRRVPRRS